MQEVKNAFKGVEHKKINVNANTAQIEYVKSQIKEIQYLLSRADKGFEVGDTLKLEAKLEKLNNQYKKLINQQNKFSKNTTKSTTSFSKGLDKMTSKIKRFGLALLSIRSIYALVSRASSAYLSQDTELANRLQDAWIGLGAILAPIIQFISTLILKLVSIINGFVKALTGVDLIAKATAKSMKSAAGGANSLKKSLAGFDELTNLDSDASGAGLANGILGSLKNIDTDFENQMKSLEKTIDKIYGNLRKKALDYIQWQKDLLKKYGFTEAFIEAYDLASRGSLQVLDGFVEAIKGILKTIRGLLSGDKEAIKEGLKELVNGLKDILFGFLKTLGGIFSMILIGIGDLWNAISSKNRNFFENLYQKINELPGGIRMSLNMIVGFFDGFINIILSIFDGVFNAIRSLGRAIVSFFNGDIKGGFAQIARAIGNIFIGVINAVSSALNAISSPIRSMVVEIGKVTGKNWTMSKISIPKIPYLEIGTNYVPEDQLAMIHKGEAVIPKKFNSQEYFNGSDDETKELLRELISKVEGIEINPYTTIRDVGKASLSYINNKSRQLGESVVV